MKNFKTLLVWQKAHDLAIKIYKETEKLPKSESYGLTSQIRRSCISIPANIAEGCGRSSEPYFNRFLYISFGSACELEYYLFLSRDLNFLSHKSHDCLLTQLVEIKKMLASLISRLKS